MDTTIFEIDEIKTAQTSLLVVGSIYIAVKNYEKLA